MSFLFGGSEDTSQTTQTQTQAAPQFVQAPEYPESTAARGTWWDTLQNWGKQPGYGAIQPDWNQIWNTASNKVNQYYWGGPTGPGLADKLKSSAAARGASQSPALEETLKNMGAAQGDQLSTMATQMGVQQTNLEQQGQSNWLNSLMALGQIKPTSTAYTPSSTTQSTTTSPTQSLLGSLLGVTGQVAGQSSNSNFLTSLMASMGLAGSGGIAAGAGATAGAATGAAMGGSIAADTMGGMSMAELLPMFAAL
jgi:hypothetical protein